MDLPNQPKPIWQVYESSIRSKVEEQLNELENQGYEIRHILHVNEGHEAERVWIFSRLRSAE